MLLNMIFVKERTKIVELIAETKRSGRLEDILCPLDSLRGTVY